MKVSSPPSIFPVDYCSFKWHFSFTSSTSFIRLLGWMHRKLRPNNGGDGFKDFGDGVAGAGLCICGWTSPDEDLHRRRCRQYEPFHARPRGLRVDAEELSEGGGGGGDPAVEEIFEGFLAIGSLGVGSWPIEEEDEAAIEKSQKESVAGEDLVVARAALETIAEQEAEATTETDLMAAKTELEKVLAAEAERNGGWRSSAARSSHAGSSSSSASACPLQAFLFGSSSEVADAAVAAGSCCKEKRRPSLAELFMMSHIAEEATSRAKAAKAAAAAAAGGGGSAVDWEEKATTEMRLLNKRTPKRRGWKGSDGADGSTPETKIQKVLQMFHRKVHPQNSASTRRSCKIAKIEKKHYLPLIGGSAMKLKDERRILEITENSSSSAMNVDRGHWIKTDANYVVLEL